MSEEGLGCVQIVGVGQNLNLSKKYEKGRTWLCPSSMSWKDLIESRASKVLIVFKE